MKIVVVCIVLALSTALAQEIEFPPSFQKLAEKAVESVDVTLDGAMLKAASKFLSEKKTEEGEAKKLVSGLKAIRVRSFKFAQEAEYSEADVAPIRSQLSSSSGWSRVVSAKSGRENAGVYLRKEGDAVVGLLVLAMEPKELTVVNIVGPIDLDQLSNLGGSLGIPRVSIKSKEKDQKEKDDE
ncbi:MAG TPA: DUF4252 domain-containing protein [Bryobacteraceae bacterium]|nr:DUF4252 domain-containing protein [Bryobacteraceae bacterium]